MELKGGYNIRQVLNYGYRSWREFFNDRQLLALGWLHAAILKLPDDAARAALRTVFSGVLEFNNTFNDRRVILISQFLVETCAGRSAEELSDALSSSLTDLDLAALRLLESQTIQAGKRVGHDEKQLALFDQTNPQLHHR